MDSRAEFEFDYIPLQSAPHYCGRDPYGLDCGGEMRGGALFQLPPNMDALSLGYDEQGTPANHAHEWHLMFL